MIILHTQHLDGRGRQVVLESSPRIGSPNCHMVIVFSQALRGIEIAKAIQVFCQDQACNILPRSKHLVLF
jgi:hypothetical protein